MNIKHLIAVIVSSIILTGCGSSILTGVSVEQSKVYPLVMVANSDIVCGNTTLKKGAIFSVADVSDGRYNGINVNNLGSEQHFPKDSLYIKGLENAYTFSPLVYPDGQFVFKDGYLVSPVALNQGKDNKQDEILLWSVNPVVCKYNGATPFTPKRN